MFILKPFGSELANSGVKATNAYGWGVRFESNSLQSLASGFFGLMHLGSRIRNRILLEILDHGDYSKKSLFDAGCGIALESIYLAPKFKKVVAVDIEKQKTREAKKLAQKRSIKNIKIITADLTKGKPIKETFDVIISLEVLEHVLSDKKFILTLEKLLKKDGIIILSSPAKTLLSKIAQKSLDHHHVGYNPKDIERLLKPTNLEIVEQYSYGKSILGKLVIATDFVFKKTIPVLSIIFFPPFYPALILDLKLPGFGIPRGFVSIIKRKQK